MKISDSIRDFLSSAPPGWVFSPSDLAQFGSPHAIGMTLTRLVRSGHIERVARGLYLVPATHSLLGKLPAAPEQVIAAIVRRDKIIVRRAGAFTANQLGLIDQVPARTLYDTTGPSRRIHIGKLVLELRHRGGRALRSASPDGYALISALEELGRQHADSDRLTSLKGTISTAVCQQLLEDVKYAPVWMRQPILLVADAPSRTQHYEAKPKHVRTSDTEHRE